MRRRFRAGWPFFFSEGGEGGGSGQERMEQTKTESL